MFLLLLRNWQLMIIGLLAAIILFCTVYIRYLRAETISLQAEKKAVELQLETANAQIAQCNGKIDSQNRAIDEWKKESDERARRINSELSKLKKQTQLGQQAALDIINNKPQTSMSSCENAIRIINQELKNSKNLEK